MNLQRAYSLLEIKSIDEDKREITGIATTPEPDRAGDIVEPKGAEFKLPIPLLWQHDRYQPIGEVFAAKVTAKGIEIRARVTKVDEPGLLKDRLDEAWQSIKAKLVRGLSVGFKPIESAAIKDSYSVRFVKWLWLELSAVTIPMNGDATIQTVKAIDSVARAASGNSRSGVVRLDDPPGASGKSSKPTKPKPEEGKQMNVQEQIKSFTDTRAAKVAAMSAIMEKAGETGETLDTEASEKYDTLAGEVATIDKHLERLKAHEAAVVVKAAVVPTPDTGAAGALIARAGGSPHVIAVAKKDAPGVAFARYAGVVAHAKGNLRDAIEFAQGRFPEEKPLHGILKMLVTTSPEEMILRAAVAAGNTTDTTWAAPLVQYNDMANEFIEFLRPQTIVGRIPGLRRVPFNIRMPRQTTGGAAYWVGEGKPKGLTKLDFDNITLRFTKLATIAVLTDELVRFSQPSAEILVRDQLAKAIVQQQDSDFINPQNAGTANVKPASITNGVVPIDSTGGDEVDVRRDIQAIFAPWIAANLSPSTAVWVMSATTALGLSLMVNHLGQPSFPGISMAGGTFMGMPAIVSEAAALSDSAGGIVVLLNASDILIADDGQVTVDASREASLQMDSAPDDPATAATVHVSLWQQNLVGIKAERYINWVKARSTAVQLLEGVNWGTSAS